MITEVLCIKDLECVSSKLSCCNATLCSFDSLSWSGLTARWSGRQMNPCFFEYTNTAVWSKLESCISMIGILGHVYRKKGYKNNIAVKDCIRDFWEYPLPENEGGHFSTNCFLLFRPQSLVSKVPWIFFCRHLSVRLVCWLGKPLFRLLCLDIASLGIQRRDLWATIKQMHNE